MISLALDIADFALFFLAGIGGSVLIAAAIAVLSGFVRDRKTKAAKRMEAEAALVAEQNAAALMGGEPNSIREPRLIHRITLPRAVYHGHPMPEDDKSPYEAEAPGDAGGPYGGSSAPPNSSATSYFHRLIRHGHNPLEAALIARGLGDIHFSDYYSPKQMLEFGMAWVMDRSFPREGPTWESRFWLGVKYRYVQLHSGDIVEEPVSPDERQRPTDQERTQWVHDAMRLIYPAWALEGVVPAISDGGNGR